MSVSSGSVANDSSRAFGTFESFFSGGAAKKLHCTPIEPMPVRCVTVTGLKIDVVRFAAIVLYFYIITCVQVAQELRTAGSMKTVHLHLTTESMKTVHLTTGSIKVAHLDLLPVLLLFELLT